ncbi:DUF6126 family protein [Streptomyces atratus]|uniref:Uncharacterized protein n=1 Tax=Streptomyces atratus TaxID=1893 RepID=A0A2Z5JF61_STRAR|nr:hypothetical protein C5746_20180 [Streptomyces atratus]
MGGGGGDGGESERRKERGVALCVFVHVFATHPFAGFIWILFYAGERAKTGCGVAATRRPKRSTRSRPRGICRHSPRRSC